jgi:mono/diheme cytochrome c family protein
MIMHGLMGPITVAGQEYGRATPIPMPPSGLNDQQIAEVLTWIRNEHGKGASPISTAEVEAVRGKHKDRTALWTLDELKK